MFYPGVSIGGFKQVNAGWINNLTPKIAKIRRILEEEGREEGREHYKEID